MMIARCGPRFALEAAHLGGAVSRSDLIRAGDTVATLILASAANDTLDGFYQDVGLWVRPPAYWLPPSNAREEDVRASFVPFLMMMPEVFVFADELCLNAMRVEPLLRLRGPDPFVSGPALSDVEMRGINIAMTDLIYDQISAFMAGRYGPTQIFVETTPPPTPERDSEIGTDPGPSP